MSVDVLMIVIIMSGIGLSGAYLRAEFVSWRRFNAAERRKRSPSAISVQTSSTE
jgi:hypothetical protein